jgi:hypothetical protein
VPKGRSNDRETNGKAWKRATRLATSRANAVERKNLTIDSDAPPRMPEGVEIRVGRIPLPANKCGRTSWAKASEAPRTRTAIGSQWRPSPNSWRSYSTWLRDAGVSIDLIGVSMGHTGKSMVERVYGRIKSDDDLLRLMRSQLLAATFAAAQVAADFEDESEDPRNVAIPPWFRRKDSNLDKRLQRPLSCH